MAATVSRFCTQPVGYERRYYNEGVPGSYDLVHATCLEDSLGV